MTRTCVFVGPSAGVVKLPDGWTRFAPAAMGAVFLAVEEGYQRIGLADGYFGNVPSVWHKEVLYALTRGVEVFGAASMGALRAAELAPYGMVGAGTIYRWYSAGALVDDEEVCLIHGPAEWHFRPLSLPTVNVRYALRRLRRAGTIDRAFERAAISAIKTIHFTQRSTEQVEAVLEDLCRESRTKYSVCSYREAYADLKVQDYAAMIARMRAGPAQPYAGPPWAEIETAKWAPQFVAKASDIPRLEPW